MATNQSTPTVDINKLLDGTLDDLADRPEFRPFPAGSYTLQFKIEVDKKIPTIYYARLKVVETIELSNTEDVPMEKGGESGVRMDLSNEYGQGDFKELMKSLALKFGAKSNRALLEECKEYIDVLAVIDTRENKKDGKVYNAILEMQVV